MLSTQELRKLYDSFCAFGSSRNLSSSSLDQLYGQQMDNSRFAKFTKDCKIVDNKLVTGTDVDILFNKCKTKGSRKLDWANFLLAINELAIKRYPKLNQKDAYNALMFLISDKFPKTSGTVYYFLQKGNKFDSFGIQQTY